MEPSGLSFTVVVFPLFNQNEVVLADLSRAIVLFLLKLYLRSFCECMSVCVCMESFSPFPGIKVVFSASKCSVLVNVSVKADFLEHCEGKQA